MAAPPIPPPFEHLSERPFSFYPAIVGIEHNEWRLQKATWSELLVLNSKTGMELWVPRRFMGEVSRIEDPVVIVGLNKELEYKGGMLVPFQRRLISMPSGAVRGPSEPAEEGADHKVMKVRLERSDKGALKLIAVAVGAFILLYIIIVGSTRIGEVRQGRPVFTAKDMMYQSLTARDDRLAVIMKIGQPSTDHTREVGTIAYEALGYPDRRYTVILMGSDAKSVQYIGTLGEDWKPVHYVGLREGATTESLLRAIEKF